MNPFTRFLAQAFPNRKFLQFVEKWDMVETLVINTFREQGNLSEDSQTWRKIRGQLQKEYPVWRDELSPFWEQALIDGKPTNSDPFIALLTVEDLRAFSENWPAMQTLPVAREAINRLLMTVQNTNR